MSRDVPSLQDLINNKSTDQLKPKFLSKKERQQLALQKRQEKVQKERSINISNSKQDEIIPINNNKRILTREEEVSSNYNKILERSRGKRFKFDWKEEEDTLKNSIYEEIPMISTNKDSKFNNNKKIDIHWTEKPLDEMTSRDWRILKEDYEISYKNSSINPLRSWEESKIPKILTSSILKLGFKEPTPIQRAAIPIVLSKKDVIGVAETGSGKTLAFLIPMLSRLLKLKRIDEFNKIDGPYGLILVPTRELALQIEQELKKLLNSLNDKIQIISLIGGKSLEKDIIDLQNEIEVIIATPGRLIDCLENHYITLNQLEFLVLDECDKMIELNFGEQVEKILKFSNNDNNKRQNMLFTATINKEVEKLCKNYVEDGIIINIGDVNKELIINDRIEMLFEFFSSSNNNEEYKKFKKLEKILNQNKYKPPIIIFVNYKETGDYLQEELTKIGFKSTLIHGSKNQEQRELAINQLKNGKVDILIGTNVASRGIDINNVSLVINYQMSKKIDDFIHRIGRTGRAGNYGCSITFLNDNDVEIYSDLRRLLIKSNKKIPEELKIRNII